MILLKVEVIYDHDNKTSPQQTDLAILSAKYLSSSTVINTESQNGY